MRCKIMMMEMEADFAIIIIIKDIILHKNSVHESREQARQVALSSVAIRHWGHAPDPRLQTARCTGDGAG